MFHHSGFEWGQRFAPLRVHKADILFIKMHAWSETLPAVRTFDYI